MQASTVTSTPGAVSIMEYIKTPGGLGNQKVQLKNR